MKVFSKRLHFYCILHLKQVNPISQIWIEIAMIIEGNGQNYENQNVENQKELRKPCKPSQRRKDLLERSERRKGKRSEHRKEYQN